MRRIIRAQSCFVTKSILMALLAKWLLEHDPDARVLVVTDRDELDKQIEGVMQNAGVIGENSPSPRTTSRAEFVQKLGAATPRLLCALVHKFDPSDLNGPPPQLQGRFYVFVDECHRTQGGDMNSQMTRWLEGAIFIGFTGTPLLRKDRKMTRDDAPSCTYIYLDNELHDHNLFQAICRTIGSTATTRTTATSSTSRSCSATCRRRSPSTAQTSSTPTRAGAARTTCT